MIRLRIIFIILLLCGCGGVPTEYVRTGGNGGRSAAPSPVARSIAPAVSPSGRYKATPMGVP
jgi:hypothetical protein